MRVLVKDQTLVCMFVSDFLDEAGFKVFEAVTVLQARPNVQAVVTDTGMPGSMNALALAHVVQERWPGIEGFVTSGRARQGPTTCRDHEPESAWRPDQSQRWRRGMLRTISPTVNLCALSVLHLAWAIRSGAAPSGGGVRGDASAGVAAARFTLQLTLGLVPKLCLMALVAAVLLPELVSPLSYPVLCLVGMLFHIIAHPSFSYERVRSARWLIEGRRDI